MMKLRISGWKDYSRLSGWAQCSHKSFISERQEDQSQQKVMWHWKQEAGMMREGGAMGQRVQAASRS